MSVQELVDSTAFTRARRVVHLLTLAGLLLSCSGVSTKSNDEPTRRAGATLETSVTLSPGADTFVRDGSSESSNFGGDTVLEIKNHDYGWNRKTYLKFDLASTSGSVSAAKLRLYGALGGGNDIQLPLAVFSATNTSWTESSTSWSNQPTTGTSPLANPVTLSTTPGWWEWDITSFVQAEKNAGRTLVTLSVQSTAYSASIVTFNSKEAGTNVPQLVVSSTSTSTNSPPTVAASASGSPNPASGTTTALSVLGADDAGEQNLRYTWSTTGSPPAAVSFSANGTNAAKSTTASFTRAGSYSFKVTITDAAGSTVTSSVDVTVGQVASTVKVAPTDVSIAAGATQQFSAVVSDQFGVAISSPSVSWGVTGGGAISASGLFTASDAPGGPFTINASSGGKTGTATVTITSASSNPSSLSARGDSFVRDGSYASSNFGSSSTLEVKTHDASWNRNSYVSFDLSGSSNSIANAKLRLYGYTDGGSLGVQAMGVPGANWAESSINWNNQPLANATFLSSVGVAGSTPRWYEWDITPHVQTEKNAGRQVITVLLKNATYTSTLAIFASRESGANAPQLVLNQQGGGSGGSGGASSSGGSGSSASSGGTSSSGGSPMLLKASSNNRYLVDGNGTPQFINGESAWNLIVQLNSSDLTLYLNDRKSRGLNAVLTQLIGRMGDNPPATRTGLQPFTTAGDFSTPNAAYFSWAHSVVAAARDRGIFVFLAPAYYGYNGAPDGQGWYPMLENNSVATLAAYGRYVGTTFADLPNIVWVGGGDRYPSGNLGRMSAIMDGIKATAPHLRTAHWTRNQNSVAALADDPSIDWLNLNAVYVGPGASGGANAAYSYSPTMPAFLIEAPYADNRFTNDTYANVREHSYTAWLTGCISGGFSGREKVWEFGSSFPLSATAPDNWKAQLGGPADAMLAPLTALVSGRSWHLLVPDRNSTLVTSGRGTLGSLGYVPAAKTPDGKLAIVYLPAGSPIVVALSQFSGTVTARWYDPTNGAFTSAGTFPATGSQSFSRSATNAVGDHDWVLLFEVP